MYMGHKMLLFKPWRTKKDTSDEKVTVALKPGW